MWAALYKVTLKQAAGTLIVFIVILLIWASWDQIKELFWSLTGKWKKIQQQKLEEVKPQIQIIDALYEKYGAREDNIGKEETSNKTGFSRVTGVITKIPGAIYHGIKEVPHAIGEKIRRPGELEKYECALNAIKVYAKFCDTHKLDYLLDKEDIDNKADAIKEALDFDAWIEEKYVCAKEEYDLVNASVQGEEEKLYQSKCAARNVVNDSLTIINSIAKTPKSISMSVSQAVSENMKFNQLLLYAEEETKKIAERVKHGIEAGAMTGTAIAVGGAPTAMWIATTFGKASTGVAISALNGAAASNAALAWLGGGAVAAGGGGVAAGSALLSLMGPIGLATGGSITVVSLVRAFWKKKKLQKEKREEVNHIREWTSQLSKTKELICSQRIEIETCVDGLRKVVDKCEKLSKDYSIFSDSDKELIGQLVNASNALACMITREITYDK